MTSKYNLDAPDGIWSKWKNTVTRAYSRLGYRVIELVALDLLCQEQHDCGILEYADREGIVDHADIESRVEQAYADDEAASKDDLDDAN